jgi:F1F0 ATPase subunit 2
MSAALVARSAVSMLAGLALGLGFFALLGLNVRLYGARRWPTAVVLHLGRWALLAAALVAAARAGALPLLSLTVGILAARTVLVRRAREGRP